MKSLLKARQRKNAIRHDGLRWSAPRGPESTYRVTIEVDEPNMTQLYALRNDPELHGPSSRSPIFGFTLLLADQINSELLAFVRG